MKINKKIVSVITGISLFGIGCAAGYLFANRDLGIEGELSRTRERLGNYYTGTQSEMTMLSEFQLSLVTMELYHVRFIIWNQPNYAEIEEKFSKNEKEWDKALEAEHKKPSEFEGGSMAPMDHNMRITDFLQKRINYLNANWRKVKEITID